MNDEIQLKVIPTQLAVDPGGVAEFALQLQNRSGVVDEFEVGVLGDLAAWTTVEPPRVSIFPDGVGSVVVSIRPPRSSYPLAGTFPIGFRVRSTSEPSRSLVEECRVELKPFVEVAAEVAPRRATGRFSGKHKLRVTNRGNSPVTVSVQSEVQQGDCHVLGPDAPLLIEAGQRKTAKIKVRPTSAHWSGGDEMHQYRLSLTPQGGAPVALDAMMRQRPIARIPTALLLAAALFLGGAYVVYGKGYNPLQGPPGVVQTAAVPSPTQATTPGQTAGTAQASPSPASVPGPTPTPTCVVGAPTNVTASAGNAQATVSWSAAPTNCVPGITGYTISGTPGSVSVSVAGGTTSVTVPRLTNGTAYTFTVVATDSGSSGPQSTPSNPVTPLTVPGPPRYVKATSGDTTALVSWSAPASNGGSVITSYTVTPSPGGATLTVQAGNGNHISATVTNLIDGTTYTFTVTATSTVGTGPNSSASNPVTPRCVALTNVSLSVTHAGQLTWQGTGTCGPITGTIAATYFTYILSYASSYPITGASGTYQDNLAPTATSVSYTLTLRDAHGNTATAGAARP